MQRSAAEEAQLLSSILEGVPLGVWVARVPGGELAYSNGAFAEILGMPASQDVCAGSYSVAYHIRDREGRPYPEDRLPFSQVVARRAPVVVDDLAIARPDGTRIDVRATGKPLFDAAGTLTHVVVAFWDVTAELRAEAASLEARDRLSTALHHAPVILFAYDRDGLITVSEGAGLGAMGFASGELVGKKLGDLYRDNPTVMENHRRVLAGETFTSSADMGPVALETWLAPMRDAKGDIVGAIGVSTDITERLRLQARVAESERLAAMGRLAASVGHEINNPVAFAIEAVRLAREAAAGGEAALRAKLDAFLDDAAAGLERVRLITRDLKVFARADEDGRGPQDLDRAIAAAAKMVATRTGPHARLEIATAAGATVIADETRLVQIFVNLILNAVDALPPARAAENRIAIRSRIEGEWAVVEVADNGPGIEPAIRDRVFDPFFTTKPVGEGTGLGLFVSRNLVQSFGGTISVDDAPGGGALFTLRFPAAAGPAPRGAATGPVAVPAPTPAVRHPRVLIVDDEPRLAALFAKTLEPEYEVRVFTSGRAALAHLLEGAGGSYELVLCDLMMADVSGMALYEEIARQRPGVERTIVFMTGGVFDPKVAEFLASVPNDCLDKPFDVRAEVQLRLPVA